MIRRWEQAPYTPLPENDTGNSDPFVMLAWVTESPDVSVTICPVLPSLADGRGGDVGPSTTSGSLMGMTAFLIENPGADPAGILVQTAGIESGTRWYRAAVTRGLVQPNTFMDELEARIAQDGSAQPFYRERQIRCGG